MPAILCAIGATAIFARLIGDGPAADPSGKGTYGEIAQALDSRRGLARRTAEVVVAALCAYAISLTILGVAEAIGGASITTNFERGHSAVSAFWGLLGLAVLYVGLKRGLNWLRVVGFGLFGLALAKLFLYDLAFLSSITRAMSFLAVGALLLVAGFFVQKLSEQRSTIEPTTAKPLAGELRREPKGQSPPARGARVLLGHDLDLALLRSDAALDVEDLLERADRDFELVERRLPGRQALEPETRREKVISTRFSVCLPAKRISS